MTKTIPALAPTLVERFEREYQQFHRISAPRARQQRDLIRQLESRLRTDGDRTWDEIRSGDFSGFAGDMLAAGLHVNTVRKKMNMLRAFFGWAYAVDAITADQYLKLKAIKNPRGSSGKTKPNPYTREEIQDFWFEMNAKKPLLPTSGRGSFAIRRWRQGKGPWARVWRHAFRLQLDAMVRLALDLGLRASEIYGLSVDDLHYDNEYIVIRGKADPNTGEAKIRTVPYTEASRKAIYDWIEFRALMQPEHDRPWITCYAQWANNPLSKDRFDELLQTVVGKKWRWHRFRHTCGTEWLRAGMPLEKVQQLLGHATLQQTLCYVEIAKGDLQDAVDAHEGAFEEAMGRAA